MNANERVTETLIKIIKDGKLQLDECLTLIEIAPELMYPLAKDLGLEIGGLRDVAHDGKLGSDAVAKLVSLMVKALVHSN